MKNNLAKTQSKKAPASRKTKRSADPNQLSFDFNSAPPVAVPTTESSSRTDQEGFMKKAGSILNVAIIFFLILIPFNGVALDSASLAVASTQIATNVGSYQVVKKVVTPIVESAIAKMEVKQVAISLLLAVLVICGANYYGFSAKRNKNSIPPPPSTSRVNRCDPSLLAYGSSSDP